MVQQQTTRHSTNSTNLADLLERVLDKGIVISGDIKIKLVDIELLTIQIRLIICSVDRAQELGIDWWSNHSAFSSRGKQQEITAQSSSLSAPFVSESVEVKKATESPQELV
ncbi:MAG: gas vesicle protein [Parachlamydiaceae bacterium]